MTKKEFSIIASALRTYYPKENILPNEQAMILWYDMLKDVPYDVLQVVVQKWAATNKWSPSIAELREEIAAICSDRPKDWGEAWETVMRAISKYGSYRPQEALESFDEVTAKCVRSIGWLNLCMSEEISIERASFRMLYENYSARKKEVDALPENIRLLLSDTRIKMIEGGNDSGSAR